MEFRARGIFDAVFSPLLEMLAIVRVPITSKDNRSSSCFESSDVGVEWVDDGVAVFDAEGTARAEVILDVDDDERAVRGPDKQRQVHGFLLNRVDAETATLGPAWSFGPGCGRRR